MRHLWYAEHPFVDMCSSGDLPLLSQIEVRKRPCKLIGSARLYLDKTKRITFERDKVDLTCNRYAPRIASDRCFEIRHHDPKARQFDELGSQLFAACAYRTCACNLRAIILTNDRQYFGHFTGRNNAGLYQRI